MKYLSTISFLEFLLPEVGYIGYDGDVISVIMFHFHVLESD
jgi:hypothetical protein